MYLLTASQRPPSNIGTKITSVILTILTTPHTFLLLYHNVHIHQLGLPVVKIRKGKSGQWYSECEACLTNNKGLPIYFKNVECLLTVEWYSKTEVHCCSCVFIVHVCVGYGSAKWSQPRRSFKICLVLQLDSQGILEIYSFNAISLQNSVYPIRNSIFWYSFQVINVHETTTNRACVVYGHTADPPDLRTHGTF